MGSAWDKGREKTKDRRIRKLFDINAGDSLVVLGDDNQGIAILKSEYFLAMAGLLSLQTYDDKIC